MTDIRAICNMSDQDLEARRAQLREGLVRQVRGREELSDGLALLFDATPELREELDAFVTFERECCPGLDFSVRDASGALRLEIHGIDPEASVFAGLGPARGSEKLAGHGWQRLGRSAGLGVIAAFVLFCLVPIGLVALLGAQLAAPLGALDNPIAVAAGGLVFAGLLWRWERRREAAACAVGGES